MTMTVIEIKERDSPSSLSRYLGGQCHLLIPHHDASIQSHTDTINIIRRRHASPQTRTAPDTHALAVSSSGNRRRRSLYCTVVRTNREGLNMPILSLPPPPTRHPTTSPPGRKTTKQQTTNQPTNQPKTNPTSSLDCTRRKVSATVCNPCCWYSSRSHCGCLELCWVC